MTPRRPLALLFVTPSSPPDPSPLVAYLTSMAHVRLETSPALPASVENDWTI